MGKNFHRSQGVLDLDVYQYDLLFGVQTEWTKAQRLQVGGVCGVCAQCSVLCGDVLYSAIRVGLQYTYTYTHTQTHTHAVRSLSDDPRHDLHGGGPG